MKLIARSIYILLVVSALIQPTIARTHHNMEEVSRIPIMNWDGVYGAAVRGNLIYLGCGAEGFRIVRMTEDEHIQELGGLIFNENIQSTLIQSYGNIVYVKRTNDGNGIRIVNVGDPTSPRELALRLDISNPIVVGQNIFARYYTSGPMTVFSLANPSHPDSVTTYHQLGAVGGFCSNGHNLMAGIFSNGFGIYDVSDILHPRMLYSDLERSLFHLAFNGNLLYRVRDNLVGQNRIYTLDVFDVSNQDSIRLVSSINWPFNQNSSAKIDDDLIFILTPNNQFLICQINQNAPLDTLGILPNVPYRYNVMITKWNNKVLICSTKLSIVDVADPTNPRLVASYGDRGDMNDMAKHGDLLYVTFQNQIRVFDVSDPQNPVEVNGFQTPGYVENIAFDEAGRLWFTTKNYAYPTRQAEWLIHVWDVSDIAHPVELGRHRTAGTAKRLKIKNDKVYISAANEGIGVFEYRNEAIIQLGYYSHQDWGDAGLMGLDVGQDEAFVAPRYDGVCLVDISDPTQMSHVRIMNRPNRADEILLRDNFLLVMQGYGTDFGLWACDISNPLQPTNRNFIPLQMRNVTYGEGLRICPSPMDRINYITEREGGVRTIYLDEDCNIHERGFFNTPGLATCLAADGDLLYVGDRSSIHVLDCSAALSIEEPNATQLPSSFALSAFPNPFNSSVTISFSASASPSASLRIYDISGRLVANLLGSTGVTAGQGFHPAAEGRATEHKVTWDASSFGAGVYFVRLEAGEEVRTEKIVLMR